MPTAQSLTVFYECSNSAISYATLVIRLMGLTYPMVIISGLTSIKTKNLLKVEATRLAMVVQLCVTSSGFAGRLPDQISKVKFSMIVAYSQLVLDDLPCPATSKAEDERMTIRVRSNGIISGKPTFQLVCRGCPCDLCGAMAR